MHSGPAEVVFSLAPNTNASVNLEAGLFHYSDGPVKVPGPWKRGRPKGSINKVSKEKRRDDICQPLSTFEFIYTSERAKDIDTNTRTKIRKHVRLCQSRKERKSHGVHTNQPGVAVPIIEDAGKEVTQVITKFNLHQILGVDPFNQSPIKLEPYMHDLLTYYTNTVWKNFYTLEHLAGFNPVSEYWLHLAFQDPALIHIFIGCADAYARGYNAIITGTKGLRHFLEAISLINQRLQDDNRNVSGTTLAIIAALAMLEKGAGRHRNWQIHMQGLKSLVNQRGGIQTLAPKPFILNKVYRADLCGALDDITEPPYFEGPPMLHTRPSSIQLFYSQGFNDALEVISLDRSLIACIHRFEDAAGLWGNTNQMLSAHATGPITETGKPTSAQVARTRQLLTEVQYTLLSGEIQQRAASSVQNDRVSEYFRIILILYSITILHEPIPSAFIDRRIGSIFRRVYTELIASTQECSSSSVAILWMSALSIDLHLWAIFLAASVTDMITDSEIKSWLLMSFVKLTSPEYGNIQDWDELRRRLSRYLWIPKIHDPSSLALWSEVKKMRDRNEA